MNNTGRSADVKIEEEGATECDKLGKFGMYEGCKCKSNREKGRGCKCRRWVIIRKSLECIKGENAILSREKG